MKKIRPPRIFRGLCVLWLILLLSACGQPVSLLPPAQEGSNLLPVTPTRTLPPPVVVTFSPTSTAASPPTATPTISPTPDPYAGLTIDDLAGRGYGGGEVVIADTLAAFDSFTRYFITYPSDGLAIFGFMNVPVGEGPFPVVIALHGYIDPVVYETLDYTTRYADALASAGYLVLHPNLRGYYPSDDGPNLFRIGMAVDVLNLVALVENQAGQPGALEQADLARIGLWGHSMGGGISTRVMVVNPDIDAVLLYGAMSGDEQKNFERIFTVFSDGQRGQEELSAPPEAFERISPVYYLDRISAAVSIHHGERDDEVPPEWSSELCERLQALEKQVECFTYPNQPHTFFGDGDLLFIQRTVSFFDRWVKGSVE